MKIYATLAILGAGLLVGGGIATTGILNYKLGMERIKQENQKVEEIAKQEEQIKLENTKILIEDTKSKNANYNTCVQSATDNYKNELNKACSTSKKMTAYSISQNKFVEVPCEPSIELTKHLDELLNEEKNRCVTLYK